MSTKDCDTAKTFNAVLVYACQHKRFAQRHITLMETACIDFRRYPSADRQTAAIHCCSAWWVSEE